MSRRKVSLSGQKATPPRILLRAARTDRRWSCGDLAEELAGVGVAAARGYLWQIEEGDREPNSLALVVGIEELFGIPVESWPNFAALTRLLELRKKAA